MPVIYSLYRAASLGFLFYRREGRHHVHLLTGFFLMLHHASETLVSYTLHMIPFPLWIFSPSLQPVPQAPAAALFLLINYNQKKQ
jgi:hypothetical protein